MEHTPKQTTEKPEQKFSELKTLEAKASLDVANLRINELKIELINVRSQLSDEQENNKALITNLNEIRTTVGANSTPHTDLIEGLKNIYEAYQVAVATKQESQRIKTRDALAHLSEQLSDILDDTARILVIAGETPEIICYDTRYEIPTASDKETVDFLQSLSWISGQRIDEAA